jgi:TonB family protein
MRLVVTAALVAACGPGIPDAELRNPDIQGFAQRLATASRQRDVAGVRALLRDSVTVGGLWFEDVECVKQFAFPGEVRGAKLDELARCLTTIELTKGDRGDALPDVVVLTYGPGIELEARFIDGQDGPWLAWIGYVARRNVQDALPTISAKALEALRIAGDRNGPLVDPAALDEREGVTPHAWLKLCIDGTGAVTGAHVRQASSPKAARTFSAAVRAWQFRPFMLGGQPTPVCAMVFTVKPGHEAPKPQELPLPLPDVPIELTNVPRPALGERIAGDIMVAPDPREKTVLARARLRRVIAAFQYCIDESGRVSRVTMIRSSGLQRYDRSLLDAIRGWAFKPFLDEGRPVAVCSSVHYVYSQR